MGRFVFFFLFNISIYFVFGSISSKNNCVHDVSLGKKKIQYLYRIETENPNWIDGELVFILNDIRQWIEHGVLFQGNFSTLPNLRCQMFFLPKPNPSRVLRWFFHLESSLLIKELLIKWFSMESIELTTYIPVDARNCRTP